MNKMFYHVLLLTNTFRSLYSSEATLMIAKAIETNWKLIICDKHILFVCVRWFYYVSLKI